MSLTREQEDIIRESQARAQQQAAAGQEASQVVPTAPTPAPVQQASIVDGIGAAYKELTGIAETGMHLASSAVGGLAGGVMAAPVSGLHPDKAADIFNQVASALTYSPRGDVGKRDVAGVQYLFGKLDSLATWLGDPTEDGSPLVATGIKTAILGIPSILGLKEGIPTRMAANELAGRVVKKAATEYGVDLKSGDLPGQIANAADQRVGDVRGSQMPQVKAALVEAKKAVTDKLDAEFERVRGLQASLRAPELSELADSASDAIKGYIPEDAPVAHARAAELKAMASKTVTDPSMDQYTRGVKTVSGGNTGTPVPFSQTEINYLDAPKMGAEVQLRDLYDFNRSLSSRRFGSSLPDKDALGVLRGQFRTFMEKKFNQDMIIGDPTTIDAWKKVNKEYGDYGSKFKDNKVIRQLVEADTTPEQMRAWIFNTADAGFKTTSADVVKKLNSILGKDSAPMQALRQEFVYDLVQPLLDPVPNFAKFTKNYDKVVKKNDSLIQELAPFTKTGFDDIYKYAKAYQTVKPAPKLMLDFDKIIARQLVGSGLAKAAIHVSLLSTLLKIARKSAGGSQQKSMLTDLLGYNPRAPFISKKSLAAQAITASEISQTLGPDSNDSEQ